MRTVNHLHLITLLIAASLLSGCYASRGETANLRKEMEILRQQLHEDQSAAQAERLKLQAVIEQATKLLTRNSADTGAQVERMQTKLDRNLGKTEELQRGLEELRLKFNEFQAKVDVKLEGLSRNEQQNANAPVPEDKDQLFTMAAAKINSNDQPEARRLLRHFVSRFPSDPRMPQAQLMLGDSYFSEGKYAPAIVEYKVVLEQYQQSAVVPDALFKIGMAFYQLKYCNDAELFFSQLLKKNKRYPQADRVEKALKAIKQNRKNYNFCRP